MSAIVAAGPASFSFGNVLHGQSDNLTSIALVDDAPGVLPDGCAIRWSFRYKAGFPTNGATLYRRAVITPGSLTIMFATNQSSPDWITLGNVKIRAVGGGTVINQTSGLQVAGAFEVSFGFPVVSVGVIGSGSAGAKIEVVALHSPYIVDSFETAQPTNGATTRAVTADIIDYMVVAVSAPMTIQGLAVVPLINEVTDGPWEKVADAPVLASALEYANGAVPTPASSLTVKGRLTDAMQGLFDPSVTNLAGQVVPMGERQIQSSPPTNDTYPNVQLPTLEFLRLAAIAPEAARLLGLLMDVSAAEADQPEQWDYLLVGNWGPRNYLRTRGRRVNLAGTPGAQIAIVGGLILESATNLDFRVNGLTLGGSSVWIHFTAPGTGVVDGQRARVVELEMAHVGKNRIQVTAFNGSRIVDWAFGVESVRLMLCADAIDAICVTGADATISAIIWDSTDPALVGAPTANIGEICYWMFAARNHVAPAAPGGLVVGQLQGLWNSPPTYTANDPKIPIVGVRWNASPPLSDSMMFYYAAAYQLLRGPDQQQATVIAGKKEPLVVPPPPQPPNNVFPGSLAPNSGPWYYLDDGITSAPTTVVYGVKSVDLFGRTSAPTFSTPISLVRTLAPEPPTNVQALLRADGTVLVTWAWNGTDPYLAGFNVYYKKGSVSRSLTTGQVITVGRPGHRTFTLSVQIDTSQFSAASLAKSVVKIGDDHYVVKSATATTVAVPAKSGGASTNVPGLTMTMYLNPSTPTEIPAVGGTFVVFTTLVQAGQPVPASNYQGSIQFTQAAAATTTAGSSGFQAVLTPGTGGVAWSPADANGICSLSVGVSAYDDTNLQSTISGPATVQQVPTASSLSAPPTPQQTVEQIAFTGPPDAYGNCNYVYTANCTPNSSYHVYRTLDTTLLAVDSQYRNATGFRTLAGVSYDATVYNSDGSPVNPAPLQAVDFQPVTAPLGNADQLTVTNWNALANLYGNEIAFQRITETPISSTGNVVLFTDTGLPVGSDSRYFYRLRAVTESNDQGSFGWAGIPVQLWPAPPSRPTVNRLQVSGNLLTVLWNPNPEPEVTGYQVYLATNELDAQDVRSMTLTAQVIGTLVAGSNQVPTNVTVSVQQGTPYWVSVVAVADYTAIQTISQNPGKIVSAGSDPVSFSPQTLAAPIPPQVSAVSITLTAGMVRLSFAADPNPTAQYMLLRRVSGFPAPLTSVGTWQSAPSGGGTFQLVDAAPLDVDVYYVIWCTNESRRISVSENIAYSRTPEAA